MIRFDQAGKIFNIKGHAPLAAVQPLDFHVPPGDFVVITGRSGSGKTTLLNLVSGLLKPSSGRVLIEGIDIWSIPDAEQSRLRNRKMGFVFQFPSLLPSLTVLENVLLPTMFASAAEKRQAQSRARQLLTDVGLLDKLAASPRQLSAGQQQRAVIARSLINNPGILLADEPTSNLDEQTESEIIRLLEEIHAAHGITVLLVTHAGERVSRGSRRIHLDRGAIVRDQVRPVLQP